MSTPKEMVEDVLKFARWFADKNIGFPGACALLDKLDDLETYGYHTGKEKNNE